MGAKSELPMANENEEPKGYKVEDKRRFTTEGEAKEKPETKPDAKVEPLPPVDFVSFILSLASSVQVHLGLLPNPASGKNEKDLNLARQTIDLLNLLEEKTKGNLSKEEGIILERVLFDLRMQFVEANK